MISNVLTICKGGIMGGKTSIYENKYVVITLKQKIMKIN